MTWSACRCATSAATRGRGSPRRGLTVVHGPNGAGKSNLLEAIYFGCTARSPRTRNERELVRFGAQATRVVVPARRRPTRARAERGLRRRLGEHAAGEADDLDGAAVERLLDRRAPAAVERLPTRSPGAARRALRPCAGPTSTRSSRPCGRCGPSVRREYSRVLAQRNALLARIRSGRASQASLAAWDRELARQARGASRRPRCGSGAAGRAVHRARITARDATGEVVIDYRPRSRARERERVHRRAAGAAAARSRARLLEPRTPPRRARDPARPKGAARLRLSGRAAPRLARAPARRARGAGARARTYAA